MKRLFQRNTEEDFSSFIGEAQVYSKKNRLLRECERHGISPYIDDPSETSSDIYGQLRGVASEAEFERRLNAVRAVSMASYANIIALLAFLVSVVALVKSFT